ncbi:F0F1 ATP synthase subunit epsilon [Photobacterium sp. MCCC 1A19761]|uniref:F0F1 ATP synthase subunit epsilon n=1 Tax=Photobacterium sp. MCCC 1A19761 TaxID=3115000 RepID=UPI00307D7CED
MKTFTLLLLDATHAETIEGVSSFRGEDSTGGFGLLTDHTRFMTILTYGIARYRLGGGDWKYLAAPGGVIYFHNNRLTLCTDRFLLDDDYRRISAALQQQLLAETDKLNTFKQSLRNMEEAVLNRLWELDKRERM